jgi:hypothetical protein
MKNLFLYAMLILAITPILSGCQAAQKHPGEWAAPEKVTVPIPPGNNSGRWWGRDLVVDYKYSRTQGSMDMTGVVRFQDNMSNNYSMLKDFHLSVSLLDKNGTSLGNQGITMGAGTFDPIPFHVHLEVPADSVAMEFTYKGTAQGGIRGGGNSTSFWQ